MIVATNFVKLFWVLCASISSVLIIKLIIASFSPLLPLSFFVLVPIFYCFFDSSNSKMSLYEISSIFALVFSFSILWGIQNYGWSTLVITSLIFATEFLFWGVIFNFSNQLKITGIRRVIFIACSMTLIERIYLSILYFPTFQFAGIFSNFLPVLSASSFFGSGIVSYFVFFVNLLIADLVFSFFKRQDQFTKWFLLKRVFTFIFSCFLMLIFYFNENEINNYRGTQVKAAIIQGGVTFGTYSLSNQSPAVSQEIQSRYVSLSMEAIKKGHRILIWPETAVWREYFEIKNFSDIFLDNIMLIGGFPFTDDKTYNSVLAFDKNSIPFASYHKNILIPYHETNDFEPGSGSTNISAYFGKMSTPICFEILFPEYIRKMINLGGESIVLFSNDAGFMDSLMSATIVNQAILVAAENKKYLVRAAQHGVSVVIHPSGKVLTKDQFSGEKIIPVEFYSIKNKTFYTENGQVLLWIFLFLMYLFSLYEYLINFKRVLKKQET